MILRTVVSIYPLETKISKPNIVPSMFKFPASSEENRSYYKFTDEEKAQPYTHVYGGSDTGWIRRDIPVKKVAESVVNDFIGSCMYVDSGCHPGFFHVQGDFSLDVPEHKEALSKAIQAQDAYFRAVVRVADSLWAQLPDPMQIGDLHRTAAKYHGVTREWSVEPGLTTKTCPGCGSVVRSFAVICPTCSFILRPDKFDPANFAHGPATKPKGITG